MSGFFSLFNTCRLAEVPWGDGALYGAFHGNVKWL